MIRVLVQGTLLFLGLLLLLWVPLLVFSSGNPTYQVSKVLPIIFNLQIANLGNLQTSHQAPSTLLTPPMLFP